MAARKSRRRPNHGIESLEPRALLTGVAPGGLAVASSPIEQNAQQIVQTAEVINGTPTSDFPNVALVNGICSGTLISPTHVLTAAHCTEDLARYEGYVTLGGQRYDSTLIVDHPDYDTNAFFLGNDLSILKLERPVEGVEPAQLLRHRPRVGFELILVGYGIGGSSQTGLPQPSGILREGRTRLEQVTNEHLRWTLDRHSEANTGAGDSGGPAFVEEDGELFLAGATSGGDGDALGLGSSSFDTRVDIHVGFIDSVIGEDFVLEDDVGDNVASAQPLVFDAGGAAVVAGELEIAHDRDLYSFTLVEPSDVQVDLRGGTLEDPYLRLLRSSGREFDFDDDGGPGRDSRIVRGNLPAGTYEISVGAFGDHYAGSYRLQVKLDSGGVVSPGDDPPSNPGDDAPRLDFDEQQRRVVAGELSPLGDRDVYQITLPVDAALTLDLAAGDSSLDPLLRLYDADGVQIAANDNGGRGAESHLFRGLAAGTYFVSAAAYQDETLGPYQLSMQYVDAAAAAASDPPAEPGGGTPQLSFDSDGVAAAAGVFASEDDVDVYGFQLSLEANVYLTLAAPDGGLDPHLQLLDSAGGVIVESDDSPFGVDSAIEALLEPGFYYLRASSTGTGAYDLTARNLSYFSDPPDTPSSNAPAIELTDGQAELFGVLESAGDRDVYRLSLPESGAVSMSLLAVDQVWDPFLRIYDAAGMEVVAEDGFSFDPYWVGPLGAGDYFISIETGFEAGDASGVYRLFVGYQGVDLADAAGAGAAPLEFDDQGTAVAHGVLFDAGDRDVFEFTMAEPGVAVLDLISTDGWLDPRLLLFDESGELIAENEDVESQTLNSRITASLEAGTYYVAAASWEDVVRGAYQLSATLLPTAADPVSEFSASAAALAFNEHGRSETTGAFFDASDRDVYRLEWTSAGGLTALLRGDAGASVALFNEAGVLVTSGKIVEPGVSSLAADLAPGIYYLAAEPPNETAATPYRLSVAHETRDPLETLNPPTPSLAFSVDGRATIVGALAPIGDRDAYELVLGERRNVVIEMNAGEAELIPTLQLFSAVGDVLAADGNGAAGASRRIDLTLDAGTYYLVAASHLGATSGLFELIVTLDDDYDGVLHWTAGAASAAGAIDAPGDRDSYFFAVRLATRVEFALSSAQGDLDPLLQLFDARGGLVPPEEAPTSDAVLYFVQPGVYRVEAGAVADWTGDYLLSAALLAPGDASGDGKIDLEDFTLLKTHFGEVAGPELGDVDRDGLITLEDFSIMKSNFGLTSDDFLVEAITRAMAKLFHAESADLAGAAIDRLMQSARDGREEE